MKKNRLKYLIIGAGGTGGASGAYLSKAGKDVSFIARGEHLDRMKSSGLRVIRPKDEFTIDPVKAYSMDEYLALVERKPDERPDVILVCVKGYSLDEASEFIGKITSSKDTDPEYDPIVIPILNLYGTGGALQKKLPGILVTDGCIYVASEVKEPGVILMNGYILRILFGLRKGEEDRGEPLNAKLKMIESDLKESDILGVFSDDIAKDALLKFSYVSPQNACGIYYDVPAGPIQEEGEIREAFGELVHEIDVLADAMGITFDEDIVQRNFKILDDLKPNMTTSLQRDLEKNKPNELDGLVYEVVRMGERYGVDLPLYREISEALSERFKK